MAAAGEGDIDGEHPCQQARPGAAARHALAARCDGRGEFSFIGIAPGRYDIRLRANNQGLGSRSVTALVNPGVAASLGAIHMPAHTIPDVTPTIDPSVIPVLPPQDDDKPKSKPKGKAKPGRASHTGEDDAKSNAMPKKWPLVIPDA
ncbi:MAG: hypothetical protein H7Y61_15750 [Rhizobiales bacterium]|nr:hypothetical protein [Rhizobacter sp.]